MNKGRLAHGIVLAAIIGIALLLRLWGIRFGLPYQYHYDEHFYIATALKLGAGELHNTPYAPVGFANILAVEYGLFYIVTRLSGLVTSASAFEALYRTDPTSFFLIGRATSALLGALTALAVYAIGRTLVNPLTGLLAAAFLAGSFLHVRDSHYATPDIAMAFFVTITVWLVLSGFQRQQAKLIYLAALTAGAAVSMKWTAAPVVLPVYLSAVGLYWLRTGASAAALFNRTAVLTILCAVLGFVLTSPQIVINPTPYVNEALGQLGAGSDGGFELWQVDSVSGWHFYAKQIWISMGPLLFGAVIGGFLYLGWRLRQKEWLPTLILLAFPLVYFSLMGSTRHYFARYAMPLLPFAAVFAGVFIHVLIIRVRRNLHTSHAVWVLGVIVLLLIAQPLANSIRHNTLILREDTRTTTKIWIEENIPAGTRIATDWDVHGPPLSTEENPQPLSSHVYDYRFMNGLGLPDKELDWYRQEGYDYLVTSSFITEIPSTNNRLQSRRDDFYQGLDRSASLVKQFSPASELNRSLPFVFDEIYGPVVSLWRREQPGPTLTIYRLEP